MFKWLKTLFFPTLGKVAVFALIAAVCLIHQFQFSFASGEISCPLSIKTELHIGYPFVYYIHGGSDLAQIQILNLLLNLVVFYFAASIIHQTAMTAYRAFRGDSQQYKIIIGSVLINLALVSFILIAVFGENLLIRSIQSQNVFHARALLMLGVDPNGLTLNKNTFALKEAARFNNTDLIKLLIRKGATLSMRNQKKTQALHVAAKHNALAAAELLLSAGAKANAADQDGKSALHFACSLPMVKLLMANGADPNLLDAQNKKALDYAKNKNVIAYLKPLTGADRVRPRTPNRRGATPTRGSPQSAILLVKNRTPLATFIKAIEAGTDLTQADKQGRDAMYYALQDCNVALGQYIFNEINFIDKIKSNTVNPRMTKLIYQKASCWKKISGITVKTKPTLAEPSNSIECSTKIDGHFVKNGKRYPIVVKTDGKLFINRGGHGFIYANCQKSGFYHLVLEGEQGYRKIVSNLYNSSSDPNSPLLKKDNDTALLSFDLPAGQATLRWYYSTKRIGQLQEALKKNSVQKIKYQSIMIKNQD